MDIRAYVRDLDREEEEIRNTIMRLQIRIAQLHDTRLLLMQREEERAQSLGQPSPFGTLDGGQIVVRDRAKMMPPAKAAIAPPAPKTEPQKLANVPVTGEPYEPPSGIERLGLPAVVALLHVEGPMSRPEINRRLKVTGPDEAAKLSKTLSNMRQHGYVTKDAEQRFVALKKARGQGGKGTKRKITPADPQRAARERETVRHALAKAGKPMAIGDLLDAVAGHRSPKDVRDRYRWAVAHLEKWGEIQRSGPDRLVSLTGVAGTAAA